MLQIQDPRERVIVGLADAGLRAVSVVRRAGTRPLPGAVRRILVLRLERIGDLMMSLPALHAIARLAPEAEIDLVVGGWNRELAGLIPGITRLETMNAPWLSRGRGGASWPALVRQARAWRPRRYDVALNLEGDIRSNLLIGMSGAAWTAGFGMAGGGPMLDQVVSSDPTSHTAVNGVRLVEAVLGGQSHPAAPGQGRTYASALPRLRLGVPDAVRASADTALGHPAHPARTEPPLLLGVHVGAGRAVKAWPEERMAAVVARVALDRGATIVLTGSADDRAAADRLRGALPAGVTVIDLVGSLGLLPLAAVLLRLTALVTPDTGPMHLAAVLGTPLVAIFGPSSPDRWGPLSDRCRIVRIDLPCSPCNRIRNPPARCVGHTPDCLAFIGVDLVQQALASLLDETPVPEGTHP